MATPIILGANGQPVAAATGIDNLTFKQGAFGATLQAGPLTGNRVISLSSLVTKAQLDEVSMIGTPYYNKSDPNAATTISIASPGAGLSLQLNSLIFSYSATPTNGLITVANGAKTYAEVAITAAGAGPALAGIELDTNAPVTIVLSAGGAGVIGRVCASVSVV